jgi:PBSX family phage portal protein
MTERKVIAVSDDEEKEVPVIDDISFLRITETSTNSDTFKKDAADLKVYSGINSVTKRRISNKISKLQQGIGGAGTKQVNETSQEFLSGYDAFEVIEPPYSLDLLSKWYEVSSAHYAAVNAKVSNIVGLGYKFVESPKTKRTLEAIIDNEKKLKSVRATLNTHLDQLMETIEKFNKEDTFTETLVKVWRDYEVTGNGYIEISRKKDGTIGYIGHIPSKTMRIRRKRDGFVQVSGFKVQFFAHFGAGFDDNGKPQRIANPIGNDTPNEVIHIKKYSPTSGYYGIPDIVAAKQAVAGNEFAARYNLEYFENKAIPRYAIILKGAKLGSQAERRLLEFFETRLKGQSHRSIFIPLPADTQESKVEMKFESIGPTIEDSSFGEYRKANLADILMAHRVPVTKISVSEGATLAIAKDADKTFKEQVCAPEQDMIEKKLNRIVSELTDAFILKLDEMTLTDADTQSQIDERDVKNGIKLANEVRAERGLPGIKGGNERVDLNAKGQTAAQQAADSATPRARDSQRSAGRTDSAGNARNPKGEGRTTA